MTEEPPKKKEGDAEKQEQPSNEELDFEPPEGFGPDFINKVAGQQTKKKK
jgi:hypothetical protein